MLIEIIKRWLRVDVGSDFAEAGLLSAHKIAWIGQIEEVDAHQRLHRRLPPQFKRLGSFPQLQFLSFHTKTGEKETKKELIFRKRDEKRINFQGRSVITVQCNRFQGFFAKNRLQWLNIALRWLISCRYWHTIKMQCNGKLLRSFYGLVSIGLSHLPVMFLRDPKHTKNSIKNVDEVHWSLFPTDSE